MADNMTQADYEKKLAEINSATVGKDGDYATQEAKNRAIELLKAQFKASEENQTRTGKGTRLAVGSTRGKGSMVISYEEFDLDQPDTVPSSFKEFSELTKIDKAEDLLSLALIGFNAQAYQTASDPIAEFVNGNWDADTKLQFRTVVRNMSKGANMPIEEVVKLVKPGFESKFNSQVSK